MNYTIYGALNALANGNTTFTATVGQVGNAILAIQPDFQIGVQNILNQISNPAGWTNDLTTKSDGAWATAYANTTLSTAIVFTQLPEWKYINANTKPDN